MKVAIFIPTYRHGGLDVIESSLLRQTVKDFSLIVADELWAEREHYWSKIKQSVGISQLIDIHPGHELGHKRNLCLAYNEAAEVCVRKGFDLMISLQDYLWLPKAGVERFIRAANICPDDLLTGLTSISKDPYPSEIESLDGLYSIFKTYFYERPQEIEWYDCRIVDLYEYKPEEFDLMQILPEHWEANWAAIPVNYFKHGVQWDEDFDKGIAYENMDFARSAMRITDRRVVMDVKNHAISLPHKDYFAGEREEIIEWSNRKRFEDRWGA